jgi:hypothetical protein
LGEAAVLASEMLIFIDDWNYEQIKNSSFLNQKRPLDRV